MHNYASDAYIGCPAVISLTYQAFSDDVRLQIPYSKNLNPFTDIFRVHRPAAKDNDVGVIMFLCHLGNLVGIK